MTSTAIASRATRYRKVAAAFLTILCISLLCAPQSSAQSITTGDVEGTVTDPSGAAVPNASVTLTNVNTNAAQTATTNAEGLYKFAFTAPGIYKIAVTASGFQSAERSGVNVVAGTPSPVDIRLAVGGGPNTTVNVVEAAPALQTENADVSTNVNSQMIQDLPNAGMDLTFFAQTMPGVTMNTQSGYGNFSAQGMPGISNLFSINGMNYNDPFLSLNNSGASNLMLGANDIVEANVINNAYSGQYGEFAGSQITYISRSGTNEWHGDAIYNWNGRAMNANQFFSNAAGLPTPFNNFNQGAAYVSGPIKKNKTFFDVDYELLRNLLPTNAVLNVIPSQAFQTATLANLTAIGDSAEIPFYKQIFAIYNLGAAGATPVPGGGCGSLTITGVSTCADEFRLTPTSLNHEYLYNIRVDHQFSDKDRGYIRVGRDNGFQPTYTSPYGPTFNASSNQPQMSGQVSEIHTFNPTTVNQLNGSVLYYAAIFGITNPSEELAALPTYLHFTDGAFGDVGSYGSPGGYFYPNGRRVFQYQFSDDFSKVWGRHTFRIGYSWIHDTVSDLDFSSIGGPIYGAINTNLSDFFNGGGGAKTSSYLDQAFPSSPENGIRVNTNGGYVADDWRATDRLTISLNLRLESYSDPTCDQNCFSRLASPFNGGVVPNATSTPYDQMIVFGQHDAYAHVQAVNWEPRMGVAWRPFDSDKTVIRTGAGIFADQLPGGLAENAAFNAPSFNAFGAVPASVLAPGVPGSPFAAAAASNAALLAAFKTGGTFNSISAAVPGFGAPNFSAFPSTFKTPHYYKWNFEIQQQLPWKMMLSVNYAGMHGVNIPVADFGMNGYCSPTAANSICPNGFAGLPTAAPNPALGLVEQYLSAGTASYNGLITSLQRRLSDGLTFTVNYTWSHALDDVSNGGIANEPYGIVATDASLTTVENPFNIRANYGNADYDVRNYFSANAVQTDLIRHLGFKKGPNMLLGGWTLSFNVFARSGLPFSVVDNSATGALFAQNLDSPVFATQTSTIASTNCGAAAVNTPCLSTSQFAPAFGTTGVINGFGNTGRNSFRGPDFADVDMSVTKDFRIKERYHFQVGAQFYNLFNHPNFDNPVNDVSNPTGLFGSVINVVSPPTSLLGSFLGAGGSPRFIEFKGKFSF